MTKKYRLYAACRHFSYFGTVKDPYLQIRNKEFITSQDRKNVVRWYGGLDELVDKGLVEPKGDKGQIFTVSKRGYDYIEQSK